MLAQALGAWLGRGWGVVTVRYATAVVWAVRAYRRPMRGNEDGVSTNGVRGMRRTRRSVPRLTEAVGHRRGGRVRDGWRRFSGGGWLVRSGGDPTSSL
jgi:hypothetical protein